MLLDFLADKKVLKLQSLGVFAQTATVNPFSVVLKPGKKFSSCATED